MPHVAPLPEGYDPDSFITRHGVEKFAELIENSSVEEVVTTNTVDIPEEKRIDKITVLSVAPSFAEAIKRIHSGKSVSDLFSDY